MNDEAFCIPCDVGWTLEGRGSKDPHDVQIFGTAGVLIIRPAA